MTNFVGVLAGLVLVAVVFFFVAQSLVDEETPEDNPMLAELIEENIKPVGQVNVGEVPAAGGAQAAAEPRSGSAVYNASCAACHGTGAAGAPKVGDKAAWSARAEKGLDGLLKTAVSGLNAMPPKGTCGDCSDEELKAAIAFMLRETGIDAGGAAPAAAAAPEPAPAAAQAPAPAPAAAAAPATGGGVDLAHGEQIVKARCFACHGTGAAGAPKIGDKAAWEPRIAQGMDTLVKHSIDGIRAMPPKGTCMDCSEDDLKAAVAWLVEQAK